MNFRLCPQGKPQNSFILNTNYWHRLKIRMVSKWHRCCVQVEDIREPGEFAGEFQAGEFQAHPHLDLDHFEKLRNSSSNVIRIKKSSATISALFYYLD